MALADLFKRHKHNYKFVSADSVIVDNRVINGIVIDQGYNYTQVVNRCTDCGKYQQTSLDGHHAENIKRAEQNA